MPVPHKDFAQRFHVALDLAGVEKGRGRTAAVARIYHVSRETARKWLTGLAMPELARLVDIAVDLGASFEWLATGRGRPEAITSSVREDHPVYAQSDEARIVRLVRQLPREKRQALLTLIGP